MSATVGRVPDANKLYVGEGVTIKGAVVMADTVIVDGVLEGEIAVHNLIVRKTGTISGRGSVAGNAEIHGRVFEKLDVKGLLVLRASGRVDGNVCFGAARPSRARFRPPTTGPINSPPTAPIIKPPGSIPTKMSNQVTWLRPCRRLICRCSTRCRAPLRPRLSGARGCSGRFKPHASINSRSL